MKRKFKILAKIVKIMFIQNSKHNTTFLVGSVFVG